MAIGLNDTSKIADLKSSREFGFLQKKTDLASYMEQKDVMDLYVSMKFVTEKESNLQTFLSGKTIFETKLKPLVKTDNINEYNDVLKDYIQKS